MPGFDINLMRLQNQHLAEPKLTKPAEIVRWLGAVQAQDYAGAKWALGQRLKDTSDDLIEKAFANGDIIRTHVMRPTWHFIAPEDVRWMLNLTAARVHATAATRHRQLELTDDVFTKCINVITKALDGGKQSDRIELTDLLKNAGIAIDEHRFVHIMMELELRQLVCSGGRKDKKFTYALLDERVPKSKTLSREEALGTLAERYFTAHGPATLPDYAWWSGLTVADCKAGLEMVKHKLTNETVGSNIYWFADTGLNTTKPANVYLLPNYDEYIVSYKDRSSAIEAKYLHKSDPRGTIFNHTLIVNGKVMGIWKKEIKKDKLIVRLDPFKPLSKVTLATLNSAAKRYSKFLGLKGYDIV
ncbi:MAG: winged helix DNA-binding domain-containing protein [Mucilaginibacter sp.]